MNYLIKKVSKLNLKARALINERIKLLLSEERSCCDSNCPAIRSWA